MKNSFIVILFLLIESFAFAQENPTSNDSTSIDSIIEAELKAEYAQRTIVSVPSEIPDQQIINYYVEQGLKYDSACFNLPLYKEIYGWLGVKYQYAGLSKKGVDCAGFVTKVCNAVYATKLSGSAVHHFEKCDEIADTSQLQEGDLVFFKINKPNISHVGLYLGNGKFAHAAVHGGVMINDLREKYYSKYYFTGGRLKPYQFTSNGN